MTSTISTATKRISRNDLAVIKASYKAGMIHCTLVNAGLDIVVMATGHRDYLVTDEPVSIRDIIIGVDRGSITVMK
ncbi:MAG: hypothetical protein AB8B85_02775 [Paracoccaceae bacterium]